MRVFNWMHHTSINDLVQEPDWKNVSSEDVILLGPTPGSAHVGWALAVDRAVTPKIVNSNSDTGTQVLDTWFPGLRNHLVNQYDFRVLIYKPELIIDHDSNPYTRSKVYSDSYSSSD